MTKFPPPLSGIKLLTIAVLAALSGSALSTTLPTEPSSSPIGLSGNYELAGDLALGSTDTEQTESFYTASGNASITLTDDSSITLNNAFSIDGGLFSNATDHSGLKTKKWNTFLPKWNTLPKLMVVASVPHGAGFQQKRGWLW